MLLKLEEQYRTTVLESESPSLRESDYHTTCSLKLTHFASHASCGTEQPQTALDICNSAHDQGEMK